MTKLKGKCYVRIYEGMSGIMEDEKKQASAFLTQKQSKGEEKKNKERKI